MGDVFIFKFCSHKTSHNLPSTCLLNIHVYNPRVSGQGDLFNSARARHKPTAQHSVHHHRPWPVVDGTARVRQRETIIINSVQCTYMY